MAYLKKDPETSAGRTVKKKGLDGNSLLVGM